MQSSVQNVKVEKKPKVKGKKLYKTAVFLLGGLVRALFFTKVTGKENVPESGACFVCCNHMSNWDAVLLASAFKRPINFMAKVELFKVPLLGRLLSALGAFSVDRNKTDIGSIKTALTLIKNGEPVGIFPQGKRCSGRHPSNIGIKSGTGMLVYKTQSSVIPVSVYTKKYRMCLFRKAYVNIGKPISFEEYGVTEKGPVGYQKISDKIFDRICALNDESKAEDEKK